MNVEETLAKLDAICDRFEGLLGEFGVAEVRPHPYAKLRETHPNAGKPWSAADDDELRRLCTEGTSVEGLAASFGRTANGIRQRLERLGFSTASGL